MDDISKKTDVPMQVSDKDFKLVRNSLLATVCVLCPIPILDDKLKVKTQKKLFRQLLQDYEIELEDGHLLCLLEGRKKPKRPIWKTILFLPFIIFFLIFLKIIFTIFKKLVYILNLYVLVKTFSISFHFGYILDRTLDADKEKVIDLNDYEHCVIMHSIMLESHKSVKMHKELFNIFKEVLRSTQHVPRIVIKAVTRVVLRKTEGVPEDSAGMKLSRKLAASILHNEKYMKSLNTVFEEKYALHKQEFTQPIATELDKLSQ